MDNEKNFCCGCGEPIGGEHGTDCDEVETDASLYVGDGMYLGSDAFNALKASQKRGREMLVNALADIASRHGATVTRRHSDAVRGFCGQGIHLGFVCKGVGAHVHIDDLHGGEWALISWFNDTHPARNFTSAFQAAVASGGNGRPHHKATSHPRDWYSLAMRLDSGLSLAASGRAFEEPSAT